MKTILAALCAVLGLFLSGRAESSLITGNNDGSGFQDTIVTYPVALALSGGGARGLAGVGVLRAFEEKHIRVTAIAGTSIGGIVGGLYACGYSADQIKKIIESLDFSRLFANDPPRASMLFTQRRERERHLVSVRFDGVHPQIPHALTGGQELTSVLVGLTLQADYRAGSDFSKLKIPFKTVCTDIVGGREVVIDTGSIADAMRATMAFPLAFTGVDQGDQLLMDGGMLTPIPVAIARKMAPPSSFVVAVNSTSPLLSKSGLVTPVAIANQVTTIMSASSLHEQLAQADFVITPQLNGIGSAGFDDRDSIMMLGYLAGLAAADSIMAEMRGRASAQTRDLVHDDPTDHLAATSLVPQSHFRSSVFCDIQGVTQFPPDSICTWMLSTDSLVTPQSLKRGTDFVLHRYASAGFDLAAVRRANFDSAGHLAIDIDEGIVRRIDVEHNALTRDWVVRSHFPLRPGQPFSIKRAVDGLRDLYGTDLFDRVTLQVVPIDSGAHVIIGVKERKSIQARFGWHWDDHYQSEEFLELLNDNVFGMGLEYLLHAQYGLDRQSFYGELKADRIFSTYLTGQTRLGYTRLNRTTYGPDDKPLGERTESKFGLAMNVGRQISRLGTVTAGFSIERVHYEDDALPVEAFTLNSLVLESNVEYVDRVSFPTSGKRHYLQLRLSQDYLGSDREFIRLFSSIEAFYTLKRYVTLHPRVSLGLSRDGLPLSERFYLGGMHSLNGFRSEAINGDKCVLLNLELRLRLPQRFYLSGRYDLGDVYDQFDQLKLKDLRHGFGISLSLDSPIGPFELGYGRSDRHHERAYFSAGLEF